MNVKNSLFLCLLFAIPLAVLADDSPVRVAVFDGAGVGPSSEKLIDVLELARDRKLQISRITTEIAKKGAPEGVMVGTSAAVRCNYGNGRVFCFSAHPEMTEGLSHLIPLVVVWASGQTQAAKGSE